MHPAVKRCVASQERSLERTTRLHKAHNTNTGSHQNYFQKRVMVNNILVFPFTCRWFCHVDDDVYVNMVPLVRLFKPYDPATQKLYFGHYPDSVWQKMRSSRYQTSSHKLIVSS